MKNILEVVEMYLEETKMRTSIHSSVSENWKSSKMQKLPAIESQELLRFLKDPGFVIIRTKGSHVRLSSKDESLKKD